MFGLDNPIHILLLLVVLLLVFGAKRLPEMGKSLGEGMRGFKDSLSGVTSASPTPAPVEAQIVAQATPVATAAPAVAAVVAEPPAQAGA